jgi:hypothetical protein
MFANHTQIIWPNASVHLFLIILLLLIDLLNQCNNCEQGKLAVMGLTGGEMDSLLQITKLLFKEKLSNPLERECWRTHVNIVHLLQQESFNANDLTTLERATKRWKYLMVKLYGNVIEQPQATNVRQTKKAQSTSNAASTRAAATMSEKLLSFKFPNFEVVQHWPEIIRFLGPPWVQDTSLWEQQHLAAKTTVHHTNQINTKQAILIKVQSFMLHVLFFILAHIITCQQTHQKDAVVRHQAYAGLPSMVPTVQCKEPYTLSVDFDVVLDITQDHKWNLIDTVECEIGKSVRINHDSITSHKSAHFYGHFLQPGKAMALPCVSPRST